MFNRFVRDSRVLVDQAQQIARSLGSSTVEAEHLLLAFTDRAGTKAHDLLINAGLDRDAVRDALDAENESSLAAVGVSRGEFALPAAKATAQAPRWAASAKLALERSLKIALARGDHRIEAAHILLAVLDAKFGTVPRALAIAGVEPERLARLVEIRGFAPRPIRARESRV